MAPVRRQAPTPMPAFRTGWITQDPEGTVGVAAADGAEAQRALVAYEALDVPVVRALASANLDAMSALAEAAAP